MKRFKIWGSHVKKPIDSRIEFEGYKYTRHPSDKLRFAREMSLRQKTKGGEFTASLIIEVLHLREQLADINLAPPPSDYTSDTCP